MTPDQSLPRGDSVPPRPPAAHGPSPVVPIPAIALEYAPPPPRKPLLGPARMLPVDWAMLLLLGLPFTCLCLAGAPATWAAIALIAGVGTLYIMARVSSQPHVASHFRAQLAAAALVTIAATVGASVVFFHPHHRWWYRPHWLYGWLAAIPLGVAWFACVRMILCRRGRRKQAEDRDAVVPSVQD